MEHTGPPGGTICSEGTEIVVPRVHDFDANLVASKLLHVKQLRARIRKFYELCFLGLIDIEQPSYEQYGRYREQQGIDTQVALRDGDIRIQEKLRGPRYWDHRMTDIYVELANAYRGGDGWFEKYRDTVDYLAYFWRKDEQASELLFVLYNRGFFDAVQECIDRDDVSYPSAHLQQRNGVVGGRTSGCIVAQSALAHVEVARFRFSNDRYMHVERGIV